MEVWQFVVVPIGLGLLGFVEPCSVGAHSLFVAHLRRRPPAARFAEVVQFTITRALVFGGLGLAAGLLGQLVVVMRAAVNLALGTALVALGLAYAITRGKLLPRLDSPGCTVLGHRAGALPLGLATGLSLPACASPLLAATLAAGTSATDLAQAFLALFLFGAALSVPLGAVVVWPQAMERLSAIAARARGRRWLTGALIVALGVFMVLFER